MKKTLTIVLMLALGLGGVAFLCVSADASLPVAWASPDLPRLDVNGGEGAGAGYLTPTLPARSGDGTQAVERPLRVTQTVAGGGLIQGGPDGNPLDLGPSESLTETRWISLDGREPTTFAQWRAQQPLPPPLRIERRYASSMTATEVLSDPIVAVLVNPAVYDGIAASLAQWIADVEAEGRSVIVESASFPDPPALRAYLAGIPDLDGCLLVGDFPIPWLEWNDHEYPFDVYYMDLDGTWVDADLDGMYDDHLGSTDPEIWVGRLQASNLDLSGDEVALLDNYFRKNHAYRSGNLILPARALVYVDDDWAHNAAYLGRQMQLLFPDTTVVSEPNETRALDYGRRLGEYAAWIHVFAHSTAFQHNFSYSEGEGPTAIHNLDVLQIDPRAFFYNLFACGAARFVERNYLSGWYVFGDTYGLLTIGSTTGGSMVRGFDRFHTPLAQGASLGAAFRDWFAVEGIADPAWHYGLTLHGDPTLAVVTDEQAGEAPAGLSIAGPAGGVVGATIHLTATVELGTATRPLRYTWQATGLAPVARHAGLEDVASFTWWNAPGPKVVTLTATNLAGTVTATHVLTLTAPEIEVVPASYHETLALGEVQTRTLQLANAGPGALFYKLAEADHAPPAGSAPDPFGYTYKDSNQAGGPAYEWIEIAPPAGGSGTHVDLPTAWQGGYAWPIQLPFAFPFYGRTYDKLAIGSRGTLSFVDRPIGRDNTPLPSARTFEVETLIAPFWDFLVIDPGAVYYQDLGSMFVVEYHHVSRYGGSDGTWEVILYDNGNVFFQYQDVDFSYYWGNQGRSATVGIQGDALTGLQYSYDMPALSDGLAICFAYPGQLPDCSTYKDVSWLLETPAAGVVAAGEAGSIDLVFDARAPEVTTAGDYRATLVVASNDPDRGLSLVPVRMTVSVPPRAVADLGGTRAGGDLELAWSPVTEDLLGHPLTPDHYVVYRRADTLYFQPGPGDLIATPASPGYTDPGVLGDPDHSYTYLVTAVDGEGVESAPSNRLGVFSFALVPAATAGERTYNLIAVNLDVPGVHDADSLAAYVGSGMYMLLRYNATMQEIEWRLPGLTGINFPVDVGDAVYLYLDESAPDVISLVGGVPAIGEVGFALTPADPGGSCAYNFISVPLDRDDLLHADTLAADIGGVYTVSRWNAMTQDLTWRMPGGPGENFAVRPGYPYIVCLDETAPPVWP